jgi:hypothetical protein
LEKAHKDAINNMEALCDELLSKPCNQESYKTVADELRQLKEMYEKSSVSRPLILAEYDAGVAAGDIHDESNVFLFMSVAEAKASVAGGRLRVSIVVPKDLDLSSRPLLDVESHPAKIAQLDTLQVHDIDEPRTGGFVLPVNRAAAAVVADLKRSDKVINVLDMSQSSSSAIPTFVDGAPGWDLLRWAHGNNISKQKVSAASDLVNSSQFQLVASNGAWSMPHIDRFGVITSVRVEHGEKLWLSWPSRSTLALQRFALSGQPVGTGFLVYLRQGYTLMQPAGTPHAPYAGPYSDYCFMTGNMFTPSQNVDRQIQCLEAEAWSKHEIIDEEPAPETFSVLSFWDRMMREKSTAWPWPSQDGQKDFKKAFKVNLRESLQKYWYLCV